MLSLADCANTIFTKGLRSIRWQGPVDIASRTRTWSLASLTNRYNLPRWWLISLRTLSVSLAPLCVEATGRSSQRGILQIWTFSLSCSLVNLWRWGDFHIVVPLCGESLWNKLKWTVDHNWKFSEMKHKCNNNRYDRSLTNWGRDDRMAAMRQTTFSNAFSWMKSINLYHNFTKVCSYEFNI